MIDIMKFITVERGTSIGGMEGNRNKTDAAKN